MFLWNFFQKNESNKYEANSFLKMAISVFYERKNLTGD